MDPFLRAANESAAVALMNAGNYRGAETRLRSMLAEDSGDARALALLAHCMLEDRKDKEALEAARSAAAIDPDDHLVRSTLAQALVRGGRKKETRKEAERIAEDIASENPEDSGALFRLAIARFNTGDHISAKVLFEDAERHAGDDVIDLLNLAHLRVHEWNYAAAEALAQRAMTLDPTRSDIFQILAECRLAAKQPVEAYELALEALRLAPGDKQVMRLLTRARARSNPLLRPFLPGVDWIVEMDRRGLVIVPLLMAVLGASTWVSVTYDLARMSTGEAPALLVSVALSAAFVYALVSYLSAISARTRIRRDLRRIALPRF